MSKWLFLLPAVYTAAVLNSVVSPYLQVRGVPPDFLALAAALSALWAPGTPGVACAGLAGALADIAAPGRLGISMALWAVIGLALPATRKYTERRPLAQSFAAWAAISGMLFAAAIARGLLGEESWSPTAFATGSAAAGLYGALLALPCCWLLERAGRLRAVAY